MMKPHPHEPEPDTLQWPRLRHITEPSTKFEQVDEPVPWTRANLKRVSKLPEDRLRTRESSQTPVSQWRKQLKKVDDIDNATMEDVVPQSSPSRPLKMPDRRGPDPVFCDGNRSESIRLGKRPASTGPEKAQHNSEGHRDHSHSSPSRVTVRQVERALAENDTSPLTDEATTPRDLPARDHKRSSNRSSGILRDARPGIMKSPSKSREHSCPWRDRFMDLSAEVDQLRCELDSCEEASHPDPNEQKSRDRGRKDKHPTHECDDVGIEGLTVVVHLKGKDDLVINTDLRTD